MGQRTGQAVLGTMLTACALFLAGATAWAQGPAIELSMASGDAGQTVMITATLRTGGNMVAGTQNDFSFDTANTPVVRRTNGRPTCTVNPEINKNSTSFAFQPPMCTAETCTGVRAIVFSSEDVEPIPDGSVLYTCDIGIPTTAVGGDYPLTLSGVILSNPQGMRVCGTTTNPCGATNGSVTVEGGGGPTPTPTEVVPEGPGIEIDTVEAEAGDPVVITATVNTDGNMVAGTQNDFSFDRVNAPVVRRANGRPDCTVNPEINKNSTSFAFQPPMCTAETCTGVRAIVFSSEDVEPIPDGSPLYTCNVQVAESAPDGTYPLTLSGVILSNPQGMRVCGTTANPCSAVNGAVVVGGVVPGTPTPTPTATTPATGATATPTTTATGGATPTRTPTTRVGEALLTANITADTEEIPVSDVNTFASTGVVQINNELISYTGRRVTGGGSQGVLTGTTRGAFGTTAVPHNVGTLVLQVQPPTPTPSIVDDDGCDCRIASTGGSTRHAWMVLIPIIGLLILRRRSR